MVMWEKRVRLTKKTRPGATSHVIPDQILGTQRQGDGQDCAPLAPKEWRVRLASLAIFFLDLGLGEFCGGEAWNLHSEGTGSVVFPGGQPKGPVHWHWSI